MSIALLIKLALSAMFVVTGGAVFTDWGRRNRGLALLAASVSLVGSFYLFRSIHSDLTTSDIAHSEAPSSEQAFKAVKVSDFLIDIIGRSDENSRTIPFEVLRQTTPYVDWANNLKNVTVDAYEDHLPFLPTAISGRVTFRFGNILDVQSDEGHLASWNVIGWARHPNWGPNMVSLYRSNPITSELSDLIDNEIQKSMLASGFLTSRSNRCAESDTSMVSIATRNGREFILVTKNEVSRLGVSKSFHIILSPEKSAFFVPPVDERMRSFEDFLLYEAGLSNCTLASSSFVQGIDPTTFLTSDDQVREEFSERSLIRQAKVLIGRSDNGRLEYEFHRGDTLQNIGSDYYERLREKVEKENRTGVNVVGNPSFEAMAGQWGCDNPYWDAFIELTDEGFRYTIPDAYTVDFWRVGDYRGWALGYSQRTLWDSDVPLDYYEIMAFSVKGKRIVVLNLATRYAGQFGKC